MCPHTHTPDKDRKGRERENKIITLEKSWLDQVWKDSTLFTRNHMKGKWNEISPCEETSGETSADSAGLSQQPWNIRAHPQHPPNHEYYLRDVNVLLLLCELWHHREQGKSSVLQDNVKKRHSTLFFLCTYCHKVTRLLNSSYCFLHNLVVVSVKCYEPIERRACMWARATEACQYALTVLVTELGQMPELSSVALAEHMRVKTKSHTGCI